MRWLGFFLGYVQFQLYQLPANTDYDFFFFFVLAIVGSDMFMCSLFSMY